MSLERVDQIVNEIRQFGDSIEPYMANSATMPSPLFVCLYRLFTLGLSSQELRSLVDSSGNSDENKNNAFVRCAGFLFVRFAMPPGPVVAVFDERSESGRCQPKAACGKRVKF